MKPCGAGGETARGDMWFAEAVREEFHGGDRTGGYVTCRTCPTCPTGGTEEGKATGAIGPIVTVQALASAFNAGGAAPLLRSF